MTGLYQRLSLPCSRFLPLLQGTKRQPRHRARRAAQVGTTTTAPTNSSGRPPGGTRSRSISTRALCHRSSRSRRAACYYCLLLLEVLPRAVSFLLHATPVVPLRTVAHPPQQVLPFQFFIFHLGLIETATTTSFTKPH